MAIEQARQEDSWSASDDVRLVAAVTGGRTDAFAELYRRYAPRARSVARRVVDSEEDAQDAVAEAFAKVLHVLRAEPASPRIDFGPYLLVATRHAAVDIARRRARACPTDHANLRESTTGFDEPGEHAIADGESRLITEALTALSERERLMLWLVEVEEVSLRDAARFLGLKPNHGAQIAMRARRRLRRGYMRAHLGNGVGSTCSFTVEQLPAYVDGQLNQHRLEKVHEHLGTCLNCQERLNHLSDIRPRIRRALLFPLLLRSRVCEWWQRRRGTPVRHREVTDALSTVSASAPPDLRVLTTAPGDLLRGASLLTTVAGDITQAVGAAGPAVHRLAAAASATILVLGFSGPGASDAGLQSNAQPPSHEGSGPAPVVSGSSGPAVVQSSSPPIGSGALTEGTASLSFSADSTIGGAASGLVRGSETSSVGQPPAVAAGPAGPVPDPLAGDTGGLERTSETPTALHLPAAAARAAPDPSGPVPDPAVGGPRGLERASETPAEAPVPAAAARPESDPSSPAPDPGVGGTRGLERASETPAAGHLPAAAGRAEPDPSGPVLDPAGGGTRGLERASETPAEGHLPAAAAWPGPGVSGATPAGGPAKSQGADLSPSRDPR